MQLDHGPHAAEFLDDRKLAFIDALDAVAFLRQLQVTALGTNANLTFTCAENTLGS